MSYSFQFNNTDFVIFSNTLGPLMANINNIPNNDIVTTEEKLYIIECVLYNTLIHHNSSFSFYGLFETVHAVGFAEYNNISLTDEQKLGIYLSRYGVSKPGIVYKNSHEKVGNRYNQYNISLTSYSYVLCNLSILKTTTIYKHVEPIIRTFINEFSAYSTDKSLLIRQLRHWFLYTENDAEFCFNAIMYDRNWNRTQLKRYYQRFVKNVSFKYKKFELCNELNQFTSLAIKNLHSIGVSV